MRNDELFQASQESAEDIHERDTIPAPRSQLEAPLCHDDAARSDARLREPRAADEDGPPTLRAPPPHVLGPTIPARAMDGSGDGSNRSSREPSEAIDGATEDAPEVPAPDVLTDMDDTRPFPIEERLLEFGIPQARVPAEFAALIAQEQAEFAAATALTEEAIPRAARHAPAPRSVPPPLPLQPLPDTMFSLAPAERVRRAETRRSPRLAAFLAPAAMVGIAGIVWTLASNRAEPRASANMTVAAAQPRTPTPRVESRPAHAERAPQPPQDHPVIAPQASAALSVQPAPRPQVSQAVAPALPAEHASAAPGGSPHVRRALPEVPGGERPDTPAREDVVAALEPVREAVERCAAGRHGIAEVDLSVTGSGRVAHAMVGGDFVGSAQGSCIARVVRGAQFRAFKQPLFRVLYPFSL
jgi:hypothetical protein